MISLADLIHRHHRLTVVHVEQWIARGLLRPDAGDMPVAEIDFAPPDVARVRLLYELTEELAFDDESLDTVVNLIDQVHSLRRELTALRHAVAAQPEDVQRAIAIALRGIATD